MTVRARWLALVAPAVLAVLAFAPHPVERWALYVGTRAAPNEAHLYLDPFPDEASCRSRVRALAENAEPAFCASYLRFELGSALDAVLGADFHSFPPRDWVCLLPRKKL